MSIMFVNSSSMSGGMNDENQKDFPHCRREFEEYKVPQPTVDIIIEVENKRNCFDKKKKPSPWMGASGRVC